MRVIELKAENFKRITAITIRPSAEGLVTIAGKNAHGKSSTLDALWGVLAGASVLPSQPIRTGADTALVRLELGTPGQKPEMIATRTFARKEDGGYTTSIKVESSEGARFPQPQAVLDKLLGKLSMDPLEFMRLKPAEQFDMFKVFVPGIDFQKMAEANEADFARRREINRLAKEVRGAAELIEVPEGLPLVEPDLTALTQQLAGAANHNTQIAQRKAKRLVVAGTATRMREEGNAKAERAQELLAQAATLQAESETLLSDAEGETRRLLAAPALPAEIDTSALAQQIEEARFVGQQLQKVAERQQKLHQATKLEASAKDLTETMDARAAAVVKAVSEAKLPVEGLGFGKGEILLNGLPFDQASDAQQLRTSMAIAIAMNPTLRVMRIRDGSLLDDDSLKIVAEMLEASDYQCWLEKVDSTGTVGFVMENGAVKGATEAPAAPPAVAPAPAKVAPKPKVAAAPAKAAPAPVAIPEPTTGNLLGDDDL